METSLYRTSWQASLRRARKVSRMVCENSWRLTMSAPLGLETWTGAWEHTKFESRQFQKDAPKWRSRKIRMSWGWELVKLVHWRHISTSTTLKKKDGVLPWLITTGMLSGRRCFKASKEKTVEKCMKPASEQAVGVKKPQESQKAKALENEGG